MPGLYLLIYIERVPKDSTSLVKAVSIPLIIEAISITVTTPIITPMIVKNDRSLLARSVARASQRFSSMSLLNSFNALVRPLFLICSQSLDGVQSRCFPRRYDSRNYSHSAGCGQRAQDCQEREVGWENESSDRFAYHPCQKNADRTADCRQGDGFEQELFQDVGLARAE